MTTYISPTGNPEVWDEKPKGYFTEEEWAAAHPLASTEPPEPTEQKITNSCINDIKGHLQNLDSQYLTPRVLAGLALGDEYAKTQYDEHERLAEPLREELQQLKSEAG